MGRAALLACVAAAAAAAAASAATLPRNDFLLVLDQRAGPYRYLEAFRKGKGQAYKAARTAFGAPSAFRADGNLCRVTWAAAGITVGFATRPQPCTAAHLAESAWYGMSLFGRRWHNVLGIHVGMSEQEVRRRVPDAKLERSGNESLLVLRRRRQDEFNFIILAVKIDRAGHVASIEVPAAYIF